MTQADNDKHPICTGSARHLPAWEYSKEEGEMDSLDQWIQELRHTIDSAPRDDHRKSDWAHNSGVLWHQRYQQTNTLQDLDSAIRYFRESVDATAEGHPDRGYRLYNLSDQLGEKYFRCNDTDALEDAIQVARGAVQATSEGTASRHRYMKALADHISERYANTGIMTDLEEIISLSREILDATPSDHEDWPFFMSGLSVHLGTRYYKTGSLADLEEAIWASRNASEAAQDDVEQADYLNNLGGQLGYRYSRNGLIDDLEESIQCFRKAIRLTPDDYCNRPLYVKNLGTRLGQLYLRTGVILHLEEAVEILRQIVMNTPPGHIKLAERLNSLGNRLSDMHAAKGDSESLEEAIQAIEQALSLTPEDHPERAGRLSNLGGLHMQKFESTGVADDLDRSIRLGREAVEKIPQGHPGEPEYWYNLAKRLHERFRLRGSVSDLEEAMALARDAVAETPRGRLFRHICLGLLSETLEQRYLHESEPGDLEEAIEIAQESVRETPEGRSETDSAGVLSRLLTHRFWSTGEMKDLEQAIKSSRRTIQSLPLGHRRLPDLLSLLGVQLGARYARTSALHDLEEAIRVSRQALKALLSSQDRSKASMLSSLSNRLKMRFQRVEEMADIDEAVELMEEANRINHDLTKRSFLLAGLGDRRFSRYEATKDPKDLGEAIRLATEAIESFQLNRDRAECFDDLGTYLRARYVRDGNISDLDEAICMGREAVAATPEQASRRANRLINLGVHFRMRWIRCRFSMDIDEAISCFKMSWEHEHADIPTQIHAAHYLAEACAEVNRWEEAHAVLQEAISLIPKLLLRSIENTDRQDLLGRISGFACDAAAVSLNAGKSPASVLDILERGRGVLATSVEDMRTDVSTLRKQHPQLADEFDRLREEMSMRSLHNDLDGDGISTEMKDNLGIGELPNRHIPQNDHTQRGYERSQRFDELVEEIRQKPSFDDFLLAPSDSEVRKAAQHGPLIVINVSEFRCDALVVTKEETTSVPLPKLKLDELEERAEADLPANIELLSWLWEVIAEPILSSLGLTQPHVGDGHWTRIWWIPTGILSRFPLHAAGRHISNPSESVLERAVSSYSPSVKAMIYSRRQALPSLSAAKALLVAMDHTPGCQYLQYAKKEIEVVRKLFGSMSLAPVEPERSLKDVTAELFLCKIFHFAGHGQADRSNPSRSNLHLKDGRLTVEMLLEKNLRASTPFLAYLSACGTSRIKDRRFFDESIHLNGAFQVAGFRHVIGTLWEVNDELCVDMARRTYKGIQMGGMTDRSVCMGVHQASRELRDQWLQQRLQDASMKAEVRRQTPCSVTVTADREGKYDGSRDVRVPRDIYTYDDDQDGDLSAGPLLWVPYVHFGV